MKYFKKRKHKSSGGSFLKNRDVSKKRKANVVAYEYRSSINRHEVKIVLDATVVETYLNNRKSGSKILPSQREKILIQKIPRVNQNVFLEESNVMVKLEIPDDIRVGANLSPEENIVFVKKEDRISELDSLDNNAFYDEEFEERRNFQRQESDKLTVEAVLKNEVLDLESCHEKVMIISQESKNAMKNEELFLGPEFKHEESIPSYESAKSIDQENNKEIEKKSTRSSRKRKKCIDCDDCNNGLIKKSRVSSNNKVITPKFSIKEPKPCSGKSNPKPNKKLKSYPCAEEQQTNHESSNKPQKSEYRSHHCDHCNYKGTRINFMIHFRTQHHHLLFDDSIRCPNCDSEFTSWEEMQSHRSVCLLSLICKFCLVVGPTKRGMAKHMRVVHPGKICVEEDAKILDELSRLSTTRDINMMDLLPFEQRYLEIRRYLEMESELVKLYCPKCNTTNEKIMNKRAAHCKNCESRMVFQCQKCKGTRYFYTRMWAHLVSKKTLCNISGNWFFEDPKDSLNAMVKASSNEHDRYDCGICNFKGVTKTHLYDHIVNVHLDNGIIQNDHYLCSKCGASFRVGNVRLKKHQEFCGIAIRFPCKFCPMTCIDSKHLSNHIATVHFDVLDGRVINDFLKEALNFRRLVKEVNLERFNEKLRNGEAETEKNYYHKGIESMLKPVCIECKTEDPQDGEHCAKCQAKLNFVCFLCDQVFFKYSVAWVHATQLCENRSFTLTVEETYPTEVDLSWTNKELLYCDHCEFKNTNKLILGNHIKRVHLDHFTNCPKCYRSFDNVNDLHQHKRSCRDGFLYTCRFCHKTSVKFHVIEIHIKRSHAKHVPCKDTLHNILQQVMENKRARKAETRTRFSEWGCNIRRTFLDNVKLATFYCPECNEKVHKNFTLKSDTRTCPKCDGELHMRCNICNNVYTKWESMVQHFSRAACNAVIEVYDIDHSYCLRQPPEVMKISVAEGEDGG